MKTLYVLSLMACLVLSACSDLSPPQALGTLERDRILLKTTAAEIIVAAPVAEGSNVSAGTLLVQLDDRRQQAKVSQAKAEVAHAAAVLEERRNGARPEDIAAAKARLDGARATLSQTEKNYRRAVTLVEQKLASQVELDRATAERDSASAGLENANEQLLVLTNGTRQEELDQAEASYHAALAKLEQEILTLDELSIEATRDGYLDSLPWHIGERVPAGSTVAALLANQAPYARVYVPEPYRARLHIGDTLSVRVDGIDQTFSGSLRWIARDPAFTPYYALNAEERSRLVYLAEVDIVDGNDLPSGTPAQVLLPEAAQE
ncbi:HlyD family secretion protein [Oceanicoccus sp. KOV_DT_Chl]|uniref:HlyD family secretion protein n=1 Tax=Oceanicoccus sp. KOV_DT_Chl TaxID=1904639 RepID=UPI000C7C942D|nr:HlyD family efflux transporter periplasmic adaptor subunit [Oceanicoccus sp. KOV_DT_Chl]